MGLFQKATKKESKLRLAIIGPGGAGKSWTALELASLLGTKIAVFDTEHGSASKYADKFAFDTLDPQSYEPEQYIRALHAAEAEGYDVIVLDSLSHAWAGKGGLLEQVDQLGGRFDSWKRITPKHNALIEAILACKCHVIATMRSKTEYVVEKNEKGKSEPRKVGTAPVQREGMEYEFDVMLNVGLDNTITVEKTRCDSLHGRVFWRDNKGIGDALTKWLSGEKVEVPAQPSGPATISKVQAKYAGEQLVSLFPALSKSPEHVAIAREKRLAYVIWAIGHAVTALGDLTTTEAERLIGLLSDGVMPPAGGEQARAEPQQEVA